MICNNVASGLIETSSRQCLLNDFLNGLGDPEPVTARTYRSYAGPKTPSDGYGLDEDGNYPEGF